MENNTYEQPAQFMIYREGEVDKAYYMKVQATRLLRGLGHVSYKALDITLSAMDELVQAAN